MWLHLGASIVTYLDFDGPRQSGAASGVRYSAMQYSTPELGDAVAAPMREVGFNPEPTGLTTSGELKTVRDAGYTCFGLFDVFARFHTPQDWANSTNPEQLEVRVCESNGSI